jgi:hypothetical protein
MLPQLVIISNINFTQIPTLRTLILNVGGGYRLTFGQLFPCLNASPNLYRLEITARKICFDPHVWKRSLDSLLSQLTYFILTTSTPGISINGKP